MNLRKNNYPLLLCLLLLTYATTSLAERGDRDKPIHMEADRVTVDDPNQLSTFEGNVRLQQGTLLIEASKMLVKQDKKGYSQINASGQLAHFRQKLEGVNEFAEGFGERIEYDSAAEIANIYGKASVKREGDDVRGEHIIYNTKTGVFQVFGAKDQGIDQADQGRVTIVIQPKNKAHETAPTPPSPTHTQQ